MRHGSFFTTFSGIKFYPLDPRPEEILIEDVAHALSLICRYGGHSRTFYSVAQHSCLVSDHLPDEFKFIGLMHDATEAYLGDMVRPLKKQMPEYCNIEDKLWLVIAEKWGLPQIIPDIVKRHDNMALVAEFRDFGPKGGGLFGVDENATTYSETIKPINPFYAERQFLRCFKYLTNERS